MLPDWQLPPGVDRGLWDYLHNDAMAQAYDESLAGATLLQADVQFCERHFSRPGRLIDLGCGTGRLLMHFARKGFDCLGVDLSEAMLAVAAEKVRQEQLNVRLLKANVVELLDVPDGAFDYAACLFSTLGMVRGEENRRKVLAQVARVLKPGGVFVLHVHNRRFRFGRGLGKRGKERGDRTMPQAHGGAELTLHHFTRGEILGLLAGAGFSARAVRPVSLAADGRLPAPWLFPAVRAYGYLVAAVRAQTV